jgi:NAD(P)H-hydrate epimerase
MMRFSARFGNVIRQSAVIVSAMNRAKATRIAVDIPSGLSADHGRLEGPAIRADLTITIGSPKRSFLFWPARGYVGEWVVADIGIPEDVVNGISPPVRLITRGDVAARIPRFARNAHKGERGKLVIVGGSPGLTGAPCMAALAASRSGVGLVRVAVPRSLNPII